MLKHSVQQINDSDDSLELINTYELCIHVWIMGLRQVQTCHSFLKHHIRTVTSQNAGVFWAERLAEVLSKNMCKPWSKTMACWFQIIVAHGNLFHVLFLNISMFFVGNKKIFMSSSTNHCYSFGMLMLHIQQHQPVSLALAWCSCTNWCLSRHDVAHPAAPDSVSFLAWCLLFQHHGHWCSQPQPKTKKHKSTYQSTAQTLTVMPA